jgi:hypothetical protein
MEHGACAAVNNSGWRGTHEKKNIESGALHAFFWAAVSAQFRIFDADRQTV